VAETSQGWLTLMVRTRAGDFVRRIPPSSPLRTDIEQGHAAEEAARDAAAEWGLPDFVYRAELRRTGSGSRELGDGIIVIGGTGVVLQVKSREASSNDPDKERRWIQKHARKGLAQASGTIRQLQREPADLTNRRGRTFHFDGNDVRWLRCVIIDHPDPPEGVVLEHSQDGTGDAAVVLLRRDWDFLFDQLKSMHAVVEYLLRVAGQENELGTEPARYYQLAAADQASRPADIDPALLSGGAQPISAPLLPLEPAGLGDEQGHLMVRIILEDIASSPLGSVAAEDRRLEILAAIDRLPVSLRGTWGRMMLDVLDEVADVPEGETFWRFRRLSGAIGGGDLLQLGFGVGSALSPLHQDVFQTWVLWRHYQLQERVGHNEQLRTIGVLLTPRHDGQREWDTTMSAFSGILELDEDEIEQYRGLWDDPAAA
jgi:hypothetical protein